MKLKYSNDNDFNNMTRGLLQLIGQVQQLKSVPRTGWLDRGVPAALVESVGDHSLGVAVLAWVCAIQRQAEGLAIDPTRVLLLAMVHDLPEAGIGDIPPYDRAILSRIEDDDARRSFLEQRHIRSDEQAEAKHRSEDAAMACLTAALPQPVSIELDTLWQEIQAGASIEARFVKQVDRLETYLQSLRYLRDDPTYPVASFRKEVQATIDDPLLSEIRDTASREFDASHR